MLTPSERRVLVALACWLASGLALDAVLLHRPRMLVPLLGPERAASVVAAGRDPDDAAGAAFAALPAPGKAHTPPAPARGRALAYDSAGRLDLNLADSIELVLLPGVGPALAGRILAARSQKGRFGSARDLLGVRGIGEKTLAKLLPKVAVRTAQDSLAADSTRR